MRTDLRCEMGPVSMEHETLDVVVVGAGFGGLAALRKLRDELGCSVLLLEAASGPGGVWYWNGYPGARCDVESLQYTFGFSDELSQEWCWTERFAPQQEILSYLNHVVERFDLAKDIRFNTRLTSASFDEHNCRWSLETDSGGRCERPLPDHGHRATVHSLHARIPRQRGIPGPDISHRPLAPSPVGFPG
jgi:cation diffusion facilitator CzcD-associated flavoprotein CzcO